MNLLTTKRQPLAQLLFCSGCCCGRTDRGKPELPIERLKEAWAMERLNRTVQLTISGCLGPCDLTNVTLLLTQTEQVWLGNLAGDECYDQLLAWARACQQQERLLDLPDYFAAHRVERWSDQPRTANLIT